MNSFVVISGPSTVGTDTLISALRASCDVPYIVPTATRAIRLGEQDGQQYHFITRESFRASIRS